MKVKVFVTGDPLAQWHQEVVDALLVTKKEGDDWLDVRGPRSKKANAVLLYLV